MQGVNQRVAGHPRQRRRRFRFDGARSRSPEEEDLAAGLEEGLQREQRSGFNANSTHGHQVERLVKFWPWQQLFESRGLDLCVAKGEGANRLSEEHGFSSLHFHEPYVEVGTGELERNSRGSAAGAGVKQSAGVLWHVPRSDNRFNQEPINGLVRAVLGQAEGREVDLGVPLGQQLVVGFEAVN